MQNDLVAEAWRETARRMSALGLTGRRDYALHKAHEAEMNARATLSRLEAQIEGEGR